MELILDEFAELCLTELCDRLDTYSDRTQPYDCGTTQYFPKIVEKFGEISYSTIEEIAQHLQSKGYIKVITRQMGNVAQIQITPFGIMTVESGGVTGVIDQYRQEPLRFLKCKLLTLTSNCK
ncbi:hypothetical protein CEN41_00635 [Fischerella thermalis CCMEE 5330]|uniref:MarR family transcriptional regulator n=1 Tax=Fischerella thermalis CCMEE 5330 TaxID=2019670 RepID=A0A2N6MPM0_9CYAN|nr:hypothetical protein [Fischerella thermalis]PMB48678.1 hypothetical protein CEN41_00635 [Fischerella thermalis CCMEE 5330]